MGNMVGPSQNTEWIMDGSGFITESEILRAVGGESDGECVVFLADWEGWYVILSFYLFTLDTLLIVRFWGR